MFADGIQGSDFLLVAGAESMLNNPRNAAGELSGTVTPGACPSSNVSFIAAAK